MTATITQTMLMKHQILRFGKLQRRSTFEDIASEETNQEGDNLIHLEEEELPNAEENSDVEQPSSKKLD